MAEREYTVQSYATPESLRAAIPVLAKDGWEPISITSNGSTWPDGIVVLLKRAKRN